jgi:hypothetical protein
LGFGRGEAWKINSRWDKIVILLDWLGGILQYRGITIYGEKYPTHVDEMKKEKKRKENSKKS